MNAVKEATFYDPDESTNSATLSIPACDGKLVSSPWTGADALVMVGVYYLNIKIAKETIAEYLFQSWDDFDQLNIGTTHSSIYSPESVPSALDGTPNSNWANYPNTLRYGAYWHPDYEIPEEASLEIVAEDFKENKFRGYIGEFPLDTWIDEFHISKDGTKVHIRWTNVGESTVFTILRAEPGHTTAERVKVASIAAQNLENVDFEDELEHRGIYQYWLAFVDAFGAQREFGPYSVDSEGTPARVLLTIANNPTRSSRCTFQLSSVNDYPRLLQILDIQGRVIKEIRPSAELGESVIYWDRTNDTGAKVASGVYFVRVIGDRSSDLRKLVLIGGR